MTFAAPARQLLRAKDLADSRYSEPLDVATLARAARLSQAHFSREFRRVFGESPHSVPPDPPPGARRGAAALDRSLGGGHLHHGRAAQRRLVHDQLPQGLREDADAYRAAFPPAASRARIPTCMQRVWARPVSSKLTQEANPT